MSDELRELVEEQNQRIEQMEQAILSLRSTHTAVLLQSIDGRLAQLVAVLTAAGKMVEDDAGGPQSPPDGLGPPPAP